MRVRTAVLISGNGSNLQALMDASREADYPAEISLVISDKAEAPGLARATSHGIETLTLLPADYTDRAAYDAALHAALTARTIQLVCLAGFMRILSPEFVAKWHRRLINIHPSLLPAYKGLHTHSRVLAAGEKTHGATVHWVTAELDAGEIIAQKAIPVLMDDTPQSLAQRVHTLEHWLYPQAVRQVAESLK